MKIAIVGAGVTGLVAARHLADSHDVVVLEREPRLGGHAHTVQVDEPSGPVAVDTGFIVYNEHNYPRFTRLLRDLDVQTQPSDMSFGVTCRRCGIEYSSRGLGGLFAHRRQLWQPRVWRMAIGIVRFNRWARAAEVDDAVGLGALARRAGFGGDLLPHYLRPMTGAIWSAAAADVDVMPLGFLLRFYRNHGLLRTHGHPSWRTVTGGSRRYVEALARPLHARIRLQTPVQALRRRDGRVEVRTALGRETYDRAIVATHTDQALALLEDPTPEEAAALAAVPYRTNAVTLHTDERVLPRSRRAWAAWNCHVDDCLDATAPLRMTYDLTRLQRLAGSRRYLVTLNDDDRIDPERVVRRLRYAHPLYTADGLEARRRLRAQQGDGATLFCGAYLGSGFHEDGVVAGLDAARAAIRPTS